METLYRTLTWIIMGAAFLLLIPIFSIGCLSIPENFKWLVFIIPALFYIFLLYLGWKNRIKKDIIIEPVQTSRLQSLLILIGVVLIIFALLQICIFHCGLNYFCGINITYLLLALLLITALFTAIFLPFKKHAKGMKMLALQVTVDDEHVTFEVSDDGVGFSYKHTGIGLSVCETIIKAHGGKFYMKNRMGGGAIVGFRLDKEEESDE